MKYVVEGKTFDDYEKAKAYEKDLKNPKTEELNKIQAELDKLNEAYKIQREASNNMYGVKAYHATFHKVNQTAGSCYDNVCSALEVAYLVLD